MTKLLDLLNKIVIGIIAFLLTLFPSDRNLQYLELQRTNNTNIAAPKIANAFIEKDVDALEAMMCLNIKENTEDLQDKISEMMDAVDGEITDYTWKTMGSYSETQKDRRQMLQVVLDIYLTTDAGTYRLDIMWETANNFAIEEVGIRNIAITDPNGNLLFRITAIEGIGEWHD
jgi:hypothetical protein